MICIIGGSGFIGSRLAQRFASGGTLFSIVDIVPSHAFPNTVINGDVRNIDSLGAALSGASALINLAAEHKDNVTPKSLYDQVNVEGARNICAIARKNNINKIIFTSSVAVYGFAPPRTNELGILSPFNDYGRTKLAAEQIFTDWQLEDSDNRTLVIVRPTVVFGERNRGNVYNLLKQIVSGRFVMIGDGLNQKSMAYVENVAAFLEFCLKINSGLHVYNYIDKPDFTMNQLVSHVNKLLGRSGDLRLRIPFFLGFFIGTGFDLISKLTRRKFAISSIRVKKFCSNSIYESAVGSTGFSPPISLINGIENTIRYEFIEDHDLEQVFYSE